MSSRRRIALVTIAFAVFSANISTVGAQQKLLTADQTQIVNTVSAIFTAARTDDVAKFDSVIASDFISTMEVSDSTETPSCPSSRPNMLRARAMNGT
jgi:hypothetical protein